MTKKTRILSSISLLTLLFAASCSMLPSQYYDNGFSDEEYIQAARETEEGRAFLKEYPDAEISVDRSSRFAVDFRHNQVMPASTQQSWEGIRLRVFLDPEDRQVEGIFIDCKDESGKQNFIEESILNYLEQYVKNQNCPQ